MADMNNHYAEEARARWGDTDAYKESSRRLSRYSAEQKAQAFHAQQLGTQRVVEAMRAGHSPESDEARSAAELCRLAIDEWFYPCDSEMHTRLADIYVSDERFSEHYESLEPGLAQYIHDAIYANHRNAL